jgi:cephalosporin-C deacetylase-like acetyl esterase
MPIPGLLFRPTKVSAPQPPVIFASSDGIAAEFDPTSRCVQLAREGHIVLAIDVRGFGETRAGVQRQREGYFGTDFQTALLAIHLTRPLLGQRAEDIQAATNYLLTREDVDPTKLQLIGAGQCGPVAIHFAAFDGRVKTLTTTDSIASWMEVLDDPFAIDQLTNVVPSALEYYDLPDLVQARESGVTR